MASAAIRTFKLSKQYAGSDEYALKKLSIQVMPGEVYGFLGANGAGKSTTIRLLLNFLQPTSGSASILGNDTVNESVQIKQKLGYLSGDVALYSKSTGQDLLDYLNELSGRTHATYRYQLEQRFQAQLDKPIGELSKGNRQKIGIIQAFMHEPDVIILDEPTSGLDPLMQEAFYTTLEEARVRGAAVLMSSHNLDEAQRVCDRIGIIKHGKLIREQTIDESTMLTNPTLHVCFRDPASVRALQHNSAVRVLSQKDEHTISLQAKKSIKDALAVISRFDIVSLETTQADLESEFMEFYEDAK